MSILCLISESMCRSGVREFVSKLGVFRSNVEALQAARETLRGVRGLATLRTELWGPPGPPGEFPFANCPPGNPHTNSHHHALPYTQKGGYFLSPSEWFPLPSTLESVLATSCLSFWKRQVVTRPACCYPCSPGMASIAPTLRCASWQDTPSGPWCHPAPSLILPRFCLLPPRRAGVLQPWTFRATKKLRDHQTQGPCFTDETMEARV